MKLIDRMTPPSSKTPVFSAPARESPINDILDKDSFTLEEILAQDEVLQEVKSLNIKLVEL